jgi:hypothetical protein
MHGLHGGGGIIVFIFAVLIIAALFSGTSKE